MKKTILLSIMVAWLQNATSQTVNYDVILVGVDVGDMSVTRKKNGTHTTYEMQSNTYVNYLVGSRKDIFTCTVEFENNVLISSKLENKKNGKLNEFTYITKVGEDGYKIHTEKGLSTVPGKISTSVYEIFFYEPKGGENIFVERDGLFGVVTKLKEHSYKIAVKGKDDYTYNYENGQLIRIEVPSPLGKVKMILKK